MLYIGNAARKNTQLNMEGIVHFMKNQDFLASVVNPVLNKTLK